MKKILFISLLLIQVEARETVGYYDFDNKKDIASREYNEKEDIEKVIISLSENNKQVSFSLQPRYEENARVSFYSGFHGELIIEEACCGRDKRYYLDYYLYSKKYNDFILYKHIEANGIFKENENHIDVLTDKNIILTYPNEKIGIDGKKYSKNIFLKKPTEVEAKEELKRLSLLFKDKKENYTVTNLFYFYSILNLLPIEKKTLTTYNNIAYYLQKAGSNQEAVYLLEKILEKFPKRTVAYYNLGDAYWALGEKKKAKKAYSTYIKMMKEKGKEKKIPKKLKQRVKNKETFFTMLLAINPANRIDVEDFKNNPDNYNKFLLMDNKLYLRANMRLDHRVFGFLKPSYNSKLMILFSIFTDDVKNNPYKCSLGAY